MKSPDFIKHCINNEHNKISKRMINDLTDEAFIKGLSLSVENGNLDVFSKIITQEYLDNEENRVRLLKSIISMHKIHYKGKNDGIDFLKYLENNFNFSICNFSEYKLSHLIQIVLKGNKEMYSYFIDKRYPYWLDEKVYLHIGRLITAYYFQKNDDVDFNFLKRVLIDFFNNDHLDPKKVINTIESKMNKKDKVKLLSDLI